MTEPAFSLYEWLQTIRAEVLTTYSLCPILKDVLPSEQVHLPFREHEQQEGSDVVAGV
jgi:hypothetical protein